LCQRSEVLRLGFMVRFMEVVVVVVVIIMIMVAVVVVFPVVIMVVFLPVVVVIRIPVPMMVRVMVMSEMLMECGVITVSWHGWWRGRWQLRRQHLVRGCRGENLPDHRLIRANGQLPVCKNGTNLLGALMCLTQHASCLGQKRVRRVLCSNNSCTQSPHRLTR